jgi:hypothetical protein
MESDLLGVRYPEALPEHVKDEIFDIVDGLDLAADVGVLEERRAGNVVDLWTLLIAVPLATWSNAFLQKAGEATWEALVTAARRVSLALRDRRAREPLLVVEIKDHRASFEFPSRLDLEAREAIVRVLHEREPGGRYRWDADSRTWKREDGMDRSS